MSGSSLDTWVEGDDAPEAPEADRYEVVAVLGEGTMGRVEAVRDHRLQRVVARKSLRSTAQRAGFQREARVASALEHPGIVPIYDAGDGEEGPWYTMRRIEGRSMQEALAEAGTLDERLALLAPFERLCEALAYVHEQGVVHRDVKPANVMLGAFGEVMLVDFGVAVARGESTARAAGTPAYMSPEAARGEPPDPCMDVWSLGVVLHELLAGERPFRGGSRELLAALRDGIDRPMSPSGPPELVAIVRKAMAPLGERYPDASALRADIVAYTTGRLVGAHAYSTRELVRRFLEAFRGYLLLGGLAALLIVGVAGVAAMRVRADRDRALEAEAARTYQLALALEARARSLGNTPRSREVAERALRLAPRLPWARGVLAEFASHAGATPGEVFEGSCTDMEVLAPQRGVARCHEGLRLFDTSTGEHLDTHPFAAIVFEVVADGWLVVQGRGGRLRVAVDGDRLVVEPLPVADTPTARTSLTLLTPDEELLLVADDGDRTSVWALQGDAFVFRRRLAHGVVPRGGSVGTDRLLLHGHDHTVVCDAWMVACEEVGVPGVVQRSLWSERGERALLLTTTGEAYVYKPGENLVLMDHGTAGGVVDVTRLSGDRVAVLDSSGQVEIYDGQGSLLDELDGSHLGARGVTGDGDQVWVVGTRGIQPWRVPAATAPASVRLPNGVGALATGGGSVYTSYRGQVLRLDGPAVVPVGEGLGFVKDLAFDTGRLLVARSEGGVHLIEGTEERQLFSDGARRVGFGGAPVWLSYDRELWVGGEKTVWRGEGDLAVAGGVAALATAEGRLTVVDLATLDRLWAVDSDAEVWALALSPDGRRLAYALDDHQVRMVDLASGRTELMPGTHRSFVAALAFSPSGERLASGSWDGTSRVWRDGQLEAALEAHHGRVTEAAFLDDDVLYTGSWDQTVRRWDLTAWSAFSESAPAR